MLLLDGHAANTLAKNPITNLKKRFGFCGVLSLFRLLWYYLAKQRCD